MAIGRRLAAVVISSAVLFTSCTDPEVGDGSATTSVPIAAPSTSDLDEQASVEPGASAEAPYAAPDTAGCPTAPASDGPIRIGANGGGFNGSRHLEGLAEAFDEATAAGGIEGRPIELVVAVEADSDVANEVVHLTTLAERGDLHAIVPWGAGPAAVEVAELLAAACVPGLFWLGAEAPDHPWVVPGLADRRADLAATARWLVDEGLTDVLVVTLDLPSMTSLGASFGTSLGSLGIGLDTVGGTGSVVTTTIPLTATGPVELAADVSEFDAAVVLAAGSSCEHGIESIRRAAPESDLVIVAGRFCRPVGPGSGSVYEGVHRLAWLEPPGTDDVGDGRAEALATGRAIVAILRSAAAAEEPLSPSAVLEAANSLGVTIDGTVPGLLLRTSGADPFPREAGLVEVWEEDPADGSAPGWHTVGPLIDAEGATPFSPIDRAVPRVEEPSLPCAAPVGRPSVMTGHWFPDGEGHVDPTADIVLGINQLGSATAVELTATGSTGRSVSLAMKATPGGGADCVGELSFDLSLGRAGELADLAPPMTVVFSWQGPDGMVSTVPVTWPDDFALEPPFDPISLVVE